MFCPTARALPRWLSSSSCTTSKSTYCGSSVLPSAAHTHRCGMRIVSCGPAGRLTAIQLLGLPKKASGSRDLPLKRLAAHFSCLISPLHLGGEAHRSTAADKSRKLFFSLSFWMFPPKAAKARTKSHLPLPTASEAGDAAHSVTMLRRQAALPGATAFGRQDPDCTSPLPLGSASPK